MSDHIVNAKTVTVGRERDTITLGIQAALDANESSASSPLVIMIAPGTYSEKVTVDKPGYPSSLWIKMAGRLSLRRVTIHRIPLVQTDSFFLRMNMIWEQTSAARYC